LRTSTSSSTSDERRAVDPLTAFDDPPEDEAQAPRRPWPVIAEGLVRVVHPFPSVLDGVVVALVATVAGADPVTALRLGGSMTAFQFAIGALNDLVDAPVDRIGKPGKPIPAGLVTTQGARAIVVGGVLLGLLLAAPGGLALMALGTLGFAIGAWYDLRAKGTTLSWLPFAIGIPLLPVFGWYGATGSLPALFLVLVPAAANAGTALAIANSVVDVERDEASGIESIAIALGARRASLLIVGLWGVVAILAIGTATVVGSPTGWAAAVVIAACVPLAGGLFGLAAVRGGRGPAWRELAWEVQAVGAGLLAVAWLGALSAASSTIPAV
jgi:4-hydroxybenzoate polyprenyltransferase